MAGGRRRRGRRLRHGPRHPTAAPGRARIGRSLPRRFLAEGLRAPLAPAPHLRQDDLMATKSATKSALGRVLARRKLNVCLTTAATTEKDQLILLKQLQHFSASEPDASLIQERID